MHPEEPIPKIIVICGPTGVGKTRTAVETAEAAGGEIVNADSMQVYRHMDIGTAKPSPEELARVPHHLIDILEPDAHFDANRFALLAREAVSLIRTRGRIPFVVGGTGLYIRALLHGLFPSDPRDPRVRLAIRRKAENEGNAVLHRRLLECDPESAEKIHPNDTIRIIRALEVFDETGIPFSAHHRTHRFGGRIYRSLKLGLSIEREALYSRIEERVEEMLARGLLREVETLLDAGYSVDLKSMQSIGYRHAAAHLLGDLSFEEMERTLKRDTRRYAKRQLTWFRGDPEIVWTRPGETARILDLVLRFFSEK
jgi:tRNA dimethylallyltransferase